MKNTLKRIFENEFEKLQKSGVLVVGYVVVFAVLTRLWPHPWNATAISALALFSGSQVKSSLWANLLLVMALLLSDLALGFHVTMPFVYGALLLTVWLGQHSKKSPLWIGGASLVSSVSFFVISNFGVWLVAGLYPRTWVGLTSCFGMALPFFRGQILGDLVYTAMIFGVWAFVKKGFPVLAKNSQV